jgi:hypothetical protein
MNGSQLLVLLLNLRMIKLGTEDENAKGSSESEGVDVGSHLCGVRLLGVVPKEVDVPGHTVGVRGGT